jgi:hypothetical protein
VGQEEWYQSLDSGERVLAAPARDLCHQTIVEHRGA